MIHPTTVTKFNLCPLTALYEFRVPESIELGSAVGLIRAMDADIGENAEMDYRIIGSDGPGMFDITTNRSTQEGVILLRKVRAALSLKFGVWFHHVINVLRG